MSKNIIWVFDNISFFQLITITPILYLFFNKIGNCRIRHFRRQINDSGVNFSSSLRSLPEEKKDFLLFISFLITILCFIILIVHIVLNYFWAQPIEKPFLIYYFYLLLFYLISRHGWLKEKKLRKKDRLKCHIYLIY